MIVQTVLLDALSAAKSWYIAPPVLCRLVKALTCENTILTTGDSGITLSDGSTDIGVITIAFVGTAVGTVDKMVIDTTSLGKVDLGPDTPLKITCDAVPGAGAAILTLVFDEYHADN